METALVTGASRGLGAAIAKALGTAGWRVAVNFAHDAHGASKVVDAIVAAGGRAGPAMFDVTDAEAVAKGVARVRQDLGPIDLIVNNATGPQGALAIADQTWEHYLAHFDFFVKAPLLLLQAVLADWRVRKTGRIINIGTEAVDVGNACNADYIAAKSALFGLTRSWATELGRDGITVNLVSPGWTPVERHQGTPAAEYAEHIKLVPLGRMGTPSDVASMVVFVASPAADFITGQNFAVNGGRTYF